MPLPFATQNFVLTQNLTNSPAAVTGASYDLPAQGGSGSIVQQFRTVSTFTGVTRAEQLSLYEIIDAEVFGEPRRFPGFIYDDAPITARNLTATGNAQVTAAGLLLSGTNNGRGLSDGAYIPHYPTMPFRSGPCSLKDGGAIRTRIVCTAVGVQMTICSKWGDGLNTGELSHIGPFVTTAGKVSFAWQETAAGIRSIVGTTTLVAGNEYIVDVQYEKSTGKISIYLNGVREAQATGVVDITDSTSDFQIGYNSGATVIDNLFNGSIREFQITATVPVVGSGTSYSPPAYPFPDDAGTIAHYKFQSLIVADNGVGTNTVKVYGKWRDIPLAAKTISWSVVNTTRAGGQLTLISLESREVSVPGGTTEFVINSNPPVMTNNGGGGGPKSIDVANPQLEYDALLSQWFMNYSGWSGSRWSMLLAYVDVNQPITGTLTDSPQNPLMDPINYGVDYITANGSVLATGTLYTHWYQVGLDAQRLDRATSTRLEGVFSTFAFQQTFLLNTENDEAIVADPCMRKTNNPTYPYRLYYVAGNATDLQQRHITRGDSADGILITRRRILFPGLPYLSYSMGEPSGAIEPGTNAEYVLFDSASTLGTGNQPDRRICEAVSGDDWATAYFTPNRIMYGGTGKTQMVFDCDIHLIGNRWVAAFAGSNTRTGDQNGDFNIFENQTGFAPAFAPQSSSNIGIGANTLIQQGGSIGRKLVNKK